MRGGLLRSKRNGKRNNQKETSSKNKKRKRNIKFKYKLLIAFLIPILLMGSAAIIAYQKAANALATTYEKTSQETLIAIAKTLENELKFIENTSMSFAVDNDVTLYYLLSSDSNADTNKLLDQYSKLKKLVNNTTKANQDIAGIYIIPEFGHTYTTTNRKANGIYNDMLESPDCAMWKTSEARYHWIGQHPFIDEKLQVKEGSYIFSIVRKMSICNAYIYIDVKPSVFDSISEQFDFGNGSILGFVTKDGTEYVTDSEESIFLENKKIKQLLAGEEGVEAGYTTYKGQEYLTVFTNVGTTEAYVCLMIPKAAIVSGAVQIRQLDWAFFLSAAALSMLICLVFANSISKVISKILVTLGKAQDGDLTVDVTYSSSREFNDLSGGIENMLLHMRTLISSVSNVDNQVNESAELVSSNSEILLESTRQISDAMNSIEQGVTRQAEDTEQCVRHMTSLSEQINELNSNTTSIDKVINQTKGKVKEGMYVIEELEKKSNESLNISKSVEIDMKELLKKSLAIESIVTVINDIADQTTLLSLNASIEAARAGENGLGFAVVAEEIRKLSNQSKDAVDEIRKVVNEIRQASNVTVTTVKEATDIATNQYEALGKSIKVYQEIEQNVGQLVQNMVHITDSVSNIDYMKEKTLTAVANIAGIASETTAATEEVGATITSQVEVVAEMNQKSKELIKQADLLAQEISQFHV